MHRAHRLATAAVAAVLAAACTPAPAAPPTTVAPTTTVAPATTTTTTPGGGAAPAIAAFVAARPSGPTPLTTAFTWSISDPDSASLTCALDLDADGTDDVTVSGCTSAATRTATLSTTGTRVVRLSVSDGAHLTTATTNVTVSAAGADAFGITVRVNGSMTPTQQSAFTDAAARWAQLVKGGLADTTLNIGADNCATGMAAFSGTVDDVLIDARITAIDGAGGILGQAGPCYVRVSGGLPLYGIMQFDSADVAALEAGGQLGATILHEMGHVLGLGTLWSSKATGLGTGDPRFVGTAAVGVWHGWGGTGTVPVENTGGPGTADGHWRESTFGDELMTGWLDHGATPLSRLTVAALGDLGYSVDLGPADPFNLSSLLGSARSFSVADHDHGDHDHEHEDGRDLAEAETLIHPIGAR